MSPAAPPPFRLPRYLTQDEVRRFLGVVERERDLLLFTLIYHHGLRVGEVELLRVGDVDLERGRIIIRRLKHGNASEQVLFRGAIALLRRCTDAGDAPTTPLFRGRVGPLRKRQIQALFSRFRDLAGIRPNLTCHGLRHAIATHMLDAGVHLEEIQDHLGHRSIRSTAIYARITTHHRAELFRRLESSPWIVQPPSPNSIVPAHPSVPPEGVAA